MLFFSMGPKDHFQCRDWARRCAQGLMSPAVPLFGQGTAAGITGQSHSSSSKDAPTVEKNTLRCSKIGLFPHVVTPRGKSPIPVFSQPNLCFLLDMWLNSPRSREEHMHLKPAGATLWNNLMHEADPPQVPRAVSQQALDN